MKKKSIPNFQLQRVHSDGGTEAPTLYSIEEINGGWKMGRRGFLAASFALAGFISGCASVRHEEKLPPGSKTAADSGGRTAATTGKNASPSPDSADQQPATVTGFCNKSVTAHMLKVQTLLFTKDGKYLVSGGLDNQLKFWKIPAGTQVRRIPEIPTKQVALGGPEGNLLATADSTAGGILLYDVNTGNRFQSLKETQFDYVNCLAFNPRSLYLAAGRADGKITIWNVAGRRRQYQLKGHSGEVFSVAFSPDGRYMASGAKGEILLWSAANRGILHKIRTSNISCVSRLVFSPDSRLLAAGATYDGAVRIFSVPSGRGYTYLNGHDYNQHKVFAFSPDGRFIATGALNNRILVWRTDTGRPVLILQGQRLHDSIQSLIFSPDGKYLISGGEGSIKIWMMPEGELLTCLFDPATVAQNVKVNQYTMTDQFGQIVTFTLPCGSPLPPGAVCTCNCVPGTWKFVHTNPGTKSRSAPRTRTYCSCNQVCTCVPVMY